MKPDTCPQCGSSKLLVGAVMGVGEGAPVCFAPRGTRLLGRPGSGVPLLSDNLCCLSCGLLWTRVSPERVREVLERYGNALARELLMVLEAGPYHDLPDLPEAHRAADGVWEINQLMLDGKQPDATRRFRKLTRTTWDQAIDAIHHWGKFDRERKLALFGWLPKEARAGSPPELRDHPMRDRLLDG